MDGLDNTYDPLAWGSHLPALLACIAATEGPVLELGIGHFSTPILHAVCGAAGRLLVSIEKETKWLCQFERFRTVGHLFRSDIPPDYFGQRWSVALIDDSPGGDNRAAHFLALKHWADYIVVHDYHRENEEAIGPLLKEIPFHMITTAYQPPTLVTSLTKSIPGGLLLL